jgi:hypothetical protein
MPAQDWRAARICGRVTPWGPEREGQILPEPGFVLDCRADRSGGTPPYDTLSCPHARRKESRSASALRVGGWCPAARANSGGASPERSTPTAPRWRRVPGSTTAGFGLEAGMRQRDDLLPGPPGVRVSFSLSVNSCVSERWGVSGLCSCGRVGISSGGTPLIPQFFEKDDRPIFVPDPQALSERLRR